MAQHAEASPITSHQCGHHAEAARQRAVADRHGVCGEFEASMRDGRSMHSAALHAQLAAIKAIKAMIARAVRSRVLVNSQPDSAEGSRGTRCTRSPAHTAATCRATVVTEGHWPYSVEGSGAKHQRCRLVDITTRRTTSYPSLAVRPHTILARHSAADCGKPMPAGITTTLSTTGYVRHRDA